MEQQDILTLEIKGPPVTLTIELPAFEAFNFIMMAKSQGEHARIIERKSAPRLSRIQRFKAFWQGE